MSLDLEESQEAEIEKWLSSARSISDGAILHFVSSVLTMGMNFVLNVLLTNTLGVGLYGIFTFGQRILGSILSFINLGTDVALDRFLSANLDDQAYQNRVFFASFATTAFVGSIVAAAMFVSAPTVNEYTLEEPLFTPVLRIFAFALPFLAMIRLSVHSFRGLEMPAHKEVVTILRSVGRLLIITLAVVAGYSLLGVTVAFAVAGVLTLGVSLGLVLWRTELRPVIGLSRGEIKTFFNYSLPLSMSRAGRLLYKRVDVFMVGILLSSREVGIYSVAVLLANVITMPSSAFHQLFPPVASRLYANDDIATLQSMYATVTRWIITASAVLALPLLLYRRELLVIFGPEFTAGSVVLSLFVTGQLLHVFASPPHAVLKMTDNQYVVLVNQWTFGVLNVVLNYYFIIEFGLVGAALATASVLATMGVARLLEVWYIEGLFPYSKRLWKPLVAASVSAVAMYASTFLLSGLVLVFIGGAFGALVYAALLYLFGIEPRDRQLANNYLRMLR